VIIPAYWSQRTIGTCLAALRRQTYREFEIIVVNSSPDAETERIVRDECPDARFVQSATRLLPHAARNRGAALAGGDLLVFTDPDCSPSPDWLARLVQTHQEGHAVVGGSVVLRPELWFESGVNLCKFSWLLPGLPAGPRWILPTLNVGYGRDVWQRLGPFDSQYFASDALLCWHAVAAGQQPWFEPRATTEHHHEGGWVALWQERIERGDEFGRLRAQFERWSRWRAAGYLAALPLVALLVLARAGRDACRSGYGGAFVRTLPVQLVGHLAWLLGEGRAQWRLATRARARLQPVGWR
jgi:glycosyltransferase involved in cell wall biosynthesis